MTRAMEDLAAASSDKFKKYSQFFYILFKQCAFSLMVFFAVAVLLEDFYQGRIFESRVVYFLIDAHSFFNSNSGKSLLGPLLVVAGGVVGLLTTFDNVSGRFFWLEFTVFSISGLLLLWFLIQISPPVSGPTSGLLEAYGINQKNNQLSGAVSLCLVTLSAWLANRFRLRTKPD